MNNQPNAQNDIISRPLGRRDLFRLGAISAGVMAGGAILAPSIVATPAYAAEGDGADTDVLNFALTLEFLEADFYNRVVDADTKQPYLRGRIADLARTLQRDETTHVGAVSDLIVHQGGTPVAKPNFNFPDDAFISEIGFLMLAAKLEATGVSAYLGQAPNLTSKHVLKAAASIYGNEARHVGLINYYLGETFAPSILENPLDKDIVLDHIKPYMA